MLLAIPSRFLSRHCKIVYLQLNRWRNAVICIALVYVTRVDLIEGSDRIHFSIQISLSILGAIQSQGLVKISGKIEYNPETSQFFLIQPKVEALEIAHMPIATVEKVQTVIQKIVGKALTKVEVYQLHDRDVKQKMLKAVLQSVVVSQDAQLLITLKAF